MDLTPAVVLSLVACAGLTSLLTATLGAGGGVLLLAIMAQVLPPQVIVPVHGIVQLGSNAGRAVLSSRHIDWHIIGAFLPGALAGALIGSFVLVSLPPRYIYLSIAIFTLYLCWGPKLPRLALGRVGTALAGAITTFLTLFVGATGPVVGAFIKQKHEDRFATVATFAAAMSLQHSLKAIVFQAAGFDLTPWLWLIAAMIGAGAVGTWIGLHLLRRFPDRHFQQVFRLVLSLLAVRLLWQALVPSAP
jgi:uncharacterized membrane protein YfcA